MTADGRAYSALVVTVSDRAAAGVYEDKSGPTAVQLLQEMGLDAPAPVVVPDGPAVAVALREAVAAGIDLVLTTGGTGLSTRDQTPEQSRLVIEREIPGIPELLRSKGADKVPTAILSRGIAGVAGATLIINLPGSVGGVTDGIALLKKTLFHALDQIVGGDHG